MVKGGGVQNDKRSKESKATPAPSGGTQLLFYLVRIYLLSGSVLQMFESTSELSGEEI